MVLKKIQLIACFATATFICNAQEQVQVQPKTKNKSAYTATVGLQANQLIRQIFNFSNNNPDVNNPYLGTVTILSKKNNWGLDAGIGYTYNSIFDNDGNTKRETFKNELSARLGIAKNIRLNNRFSAILCMHAITDVNENRTSSFEDFNSTKTTIKTTTSVIRYGLGPALSIRYHLNDKISIGTEANYYAKLGDSKIKVSTYQESIFQPPVSIESTSLNDIKTFVLNVPSVFFLHIRF